MIYPTSILNLIMRTFTRHIRRGIDGVECGSRTFGKKKLETLVTSDRVKFHFTSTKRGGGSDDVTVITRHPLEKHPRTLSRLWDILITQILLSQYRRSGEPLSEPTITIETKVFSDCGAYEHAKRAVAPFRYLLDLLKQTTIDGTINRNGEDVKVTVDGKPQELINDAAHLCDENNFNSRFVIELNPLVRWDLILDTYIQIPKYFLTVSSETADFVLHVGTIKRIRRTYQKADQKDVSEPRGLEISAEALFNSIITGMNKPTSEQKARFRRLLETVAEEWQGVEKRVTVTVPKAKDDRRSLRRWLKETRIQIVFAKPSEVDGSEKTKN